MSGVKEHIRTSRSWLRYALICLAMTLPLSPGQAQDATARAMLEKDTMLIGDQFQYVLELMQDRNLRVWFPEYPDTLVQNIEILERSSRDTVHLENDHLAIRQSFLITCFDSGYYQIPGQPFRIEATGQERKIYSNPLGLQVLSMEIDTSQAIFDIKSPYNAPLRFSEIWPYVLIVILALSIVFLTWKWIRDRQRKRKGFVPPIQKEPAHIMALRELDRLKEEKLWQNNQFKAYYTRLTGVVRVYLENRYFIRAMEETTEEILHDLKKSGFNDNRLYEKLNDLLSMADLVKFAKWKPGPEENETALLDAYIFVNETKLVTRISDDKGDGESADPVSEFESVVPEKYNQNNAKVNL